MRGGINLTITFFPEFMTVKPLPYWQTGLLIGGALALLVGARIGVGIPMGGLRFICMIQGAATAFLLLFGRRFWPFLLPALLLAPWLGGQTAWFVIGKATISLLSILLGAHLFTGLTVHTRLRHADALRLMLWSGLAICAISTGLTYVLPQNIGLTQHQGDHGYWLFSHWAAELLGYLVAVPTMLALREGVSRVWGARPLEFCLAIVSAFGGVWFFYSAQGAVAGGWQFLFFPLMIWVALRLRQGGVAMVTLTIAFSLGLVLGNASADIVLPAQLLLLNLAATGLLLAASAEEESSATREIAAERHNLDAILNALPTPIYLEGTRGDVVYANRAFAALTGRQAGDLAGFPAAPVRDRLGLPNMPVAVAMQDFECIVNANSHLRTLICNRLPLFDADEAHYGDCFMATDITERLASEQQLRLAAQIFESATEGIVMTDELGHILAVNPSFSRITGFSPEDAIGKMCATFRQIEKGTEVGCIIQAELQKTGCWQGELPGRRKNGESYPAWGSLSAVRNIEGLVTHHVAIFSDFTARKDAEDRLQFLAWRDPLTGLHNRTALQERLNGALANAALHGTRLAIFFLDLDRFKVINDSLGHAIGDELLQVVALRLRFCLKERDFIARFGGDEFTILVENAPGDEELVAIATRIIGEIARPCIVRGQEMFVTCSIGISRYPNDAPDAMALMRTADMAMYRAKELGKNTFQFHVSDMSAKVSERNLLEGRLRAALSRKQFVLHYQPQYDFAGEDYYGVEALIRWHHPELGMVPPASFIPLAEESGLIEAIGEWVIRETCRQMREWIDAGHDPKQVSVNLSPRQFRRGKLVDIVQSALDDAGIAPERLTLEVTESIIMQNPDEARELLCELREMGVRVAIDDFGSGYSSLAYLKLFPLDTLKIDRSFISPLPDDSDSAAIVEAVVAMSRKLKLTVVAEGVETSGQASFLRNIGCDIAQGYLYSRPLPPEMVPAALRARDFPTEV